jgi:DNA-binding response OmpR family regulator
MYKIAIEEHCCLSDLGFPMSRPQVAISRERKSTMKELRTVQALSAKPTFGHVARTPRQTRDECAGAVFKNRVVQIEQTSAEPNAEIFFDESLAPLTSVNLKEVHRLARFLPVIVLIPSSTAADPVALHKMSLAKSASERSEPTKLLGVLGRAVAHFKSTREASTVAFGDVTVNLSAMEALRKGEPVVLTTMEFKTLKYLMQNARRVISRDELLNEVWGYDNYPCTRTVDNHILRLRQKLERDPTHPIHFRTMHGAGYKFVPDTTTATPRGTDDHPALRQTVNAEPTKRNAQPETHRPITNFFQGEQK